MADPDTEAFLRAWGLEEYLEVFKNQAIDSAALSVLTEEHINALIPVIGHRAKLSANLKEWKGILTAVNNATAVDEYFVLGTQSRQEPEVTPTTSQNSFNNEYLESTPTTSPQSTRDYAEVDIPQGEDSNGPSENSPLYKLLSSSNEGKGLLLNFQKSGLLNNSARNKLCDIVVNEELRLDPSKTIPSSRLLQLAEEIATVFTKEHKSTYFIPYIAYGKLRKCAKGKLLNSLQKYRKKYKKIGLITCSRRSSSSSSRDYDTSVVHIEDLLQPSDQEISEETQQHLLWLKNSSDPQETVQEYWRETAKERLSQLLQSNKTIAEYMNEYCALKQPLGYLLLTQDFNFLYPDHTNKLFEEFPIYRGKIIELGRERAAKDQSLKAIIEALDRQTTEVNKEEIETYSAFIILPYLLQPYTVRTKSDNGKGRKTWRPSRSEARDGFISEVSAAADLGKTISARKTKLEKLGLKLQPLIVCVKLDTGNDYYVTIDSTYFLFKKIGEAVDCCFKCIHALNAKYPHESAALWTFIQKGLYKLKTPWDSTFVSVSTLLCDLGIPSKD